MNIEEYERELKTRHEALTAAYQDAKANGSRKAYAEAKEAVSAFRAKYGKVIKALDEASATGKTEV